MSRKNPESYKGHEIIEEYLRKLVQIGVITKAYIVNESEFGGGYLVTNNRTIVHIEFDPDIYIDGIDGGWVLSVITKSGKSGKPELYTFKDLVHLGVSPKELLILIAGVEEKIKEGKMKCNNKTVLLYTNVDEFYKCLGGKPSLTRISVK